MAALSALPPFLMSEVDVCIGSFADLQRLLKHRRVSTRNEAFGAECRQSAGRLAAGSVAFVDHRSESVQTDIKVGPTMTSPL
jgi:hypothetical protein